MIESDMNSYGSFPAQLDAKADGPCAGPRHVRLRIADRLWYGLAAGVIAIAVNSAILLAADLIPLATAHGGLLKLVKFFVAGPLRASGIAALWQTLALPASNMAAFKIGFHVAIGLVMAAVYAFTVEPVLRGPAWLKGLLYAVFAWVANAFIVLPWIGEGIAGSRSLGLAGIGYFAFAHTVFFVLLAVLYRQFTKRCVAQAGFIS